jgi:hypothetical protein
MKNFLIPDSITAVNAVELLGRGLAVAIAVVKSSNDSHGVEEKFEVAARRRSAIAASTRVRESVGVCCFPKVPLK